VSAIFALVMIGLSIRANARFRQERNCRCNSGFHDQSRFPIWWIGPHLAF